MKREKDSQQGKEPVTISGNGGVPTDLAEEISVYPMDDNVRGLWRGEKARAVAMERGPQPRAVKCCHGGPHGQARGVCCRDCRGLCSVAVTTVGGELHGYGGGAERRALPWMSQGSGMQHSGGKEGAGVRRWHPGRRRCGSPEGVSGQREGVGTG